MHKLTLVFSLLLLATMTFSQTAKPTPTPPKKVAPNPFFTKWEGNDALIPFAKIKVQHLRPALDRGLIQMKKTFDKIIANPANPTLENTIWASNNDPGFDLINDAFTVLYTLYSTNATPEIQKLLQEYSVKLTHLTNDFTYNPAYFKKIETLYKDQNQYADPEERKAIEDTYRQLIRAGLKLPQEKQTRMKAINIELTELDTKFSDNVLAETNGYTKLITNEKDLSGIPETALEAAKEAAKVAKKQGWLFTLQEPSYGPIMSMADNRALRKEIWSANATRASKGGPHDNQAIFKRIVALRQEMAALLGYDTYSHYTLEERMAQTPQRTQAFLDTLLFYAKPAAKKEHEELTSFAKSKGFADQELMPYDNWYYFEKLIKEKLSFNDELLKPYFKLENVMQALFDVASKLYGIRFVEDKSISVYHPDVTAYRVLEADGKLMGYFYADLFARSSKQPGAWMNSFRSNRLLTNGVWRNSQVVIVCNSPKPTATKPSLFGFYDVITLFHEFGHALHFLFAKTKYNHNIYPDFVELPSQIMENFCYEPSVLKSFAKHYQTNEPLPDSLINNIVKSRKFFMGAANMTQIRFGLIDLAWYGNPKSPEKSVSELEKPIYLQTSFYPYHPEAMMTPSFGHIAGGYASGYYSYKWSEVLDADAFEYFKENRNAETGIFNQEIANKFKLLLQKGGSIPPLELYRQFRGRDPQPQAMLRRAGLMN